MIPSGGLLMIGLVAFGGAILTFFSGFGLGTLLLPVFLLFFPLETAIALTAIVHLANNLFKTGLIGRHAHWPVVLGFGLPALAGAWLGARALDGLSHLAPWATFHLFGAERTLQPVKVAVAVLMAGFAILELLPESRQPVFSPKALPLGGALSGFFGGLSGHQGALRSAFLIRLGLGKEAFIASGILIALGIDLVRLTTYDPAGWMTPAGTHWPALATGTLSAFTGAWLGRQWLRKATLPALQRTVAICILGMALALALGLA